MAGASFKMIGMMAAIELLKNSYDNITNSTEKALHKAAKETMKESYQIVPVMTGYLKSSGVPPKTTKRTKEKIVVTTGYGGYENETGYFAWVHERLDLHHDPPTRAKFLEIPAKKMQAKIDKIVSAEIQQR